MFLTFASAKDEKVFGFGEQFTHFDLKGRRVPIWVQEQGIGRGLQPITTAVDFVARSGDSLAANIQLVLNNARLGAAIATEYLAIEMAQPVSR